jgi:hypothetical protein
LLSVPLAGCALIGIHPDTSTSLKKRGDGVTRSRFARNHRQLQCFFNGFADLDGFKYKWRWSSTSFTN